MLQGYLRAGRCAEQPVLIARMPLDPSRAGEFTVDNRRVLTVQVERIDRRRTPNCLVGPEIAGD